MFTKLQLPVNKLEQLKLFESIQGITISDLLKLLQVNETPLKNKDKENENSFGNSIIKLEE